MSGMTRPSMLPAFSAATWTVCQAGRGKTVLTPPPVDPRLAQFGQTNQGYLNKLRARVGPERTGQFLNWIDQRLVSMGYQRNTPGYFERGRDMLELDSQRVTGVAYDSKDQALTADEAAKISGLSPQEYNRAAQVIGGQGRYSWQQKK